MPRTSSYTEEIELVPLAPVAKPKRDTAPDLTKWVAQLRQIGAQTEEGQAVPFDLPSAAVKTARLRFNQAATEIGTGISFTEKKMSETVTRLFISTGKRRVRKAKGETASVATETAQVASKPSAPVGLPKPKAKAS